MSDRLSIQHYIQDAAHYFNFFETASPAMLEEDRLNGFINGGYELLQHYQTTDDTEVDEETVGLFVDCAMVMEQLLQSENLSDEHARRAEHVLDAAEQLVTAITRAVEKNIADAR